MNLTSPGYVLFLALTVLLYWLLPAKRTRAVLMLASVGFYLYAMPGQLPVLIAYLWIIYILSRLMEGRKRQRKALLTGGVILSICYLFFYKYLNFTLSLFASGRSVISLSVPMGISYITFQCIAYLAGVYKGEIKASGNPSGFFLYALFFPKITAGPIEPPDTFLAEIRKRRVLTWRRLLSATLLILVGFVKKCAAADLIAPAVNNVFALDGGADGLSTLGAIALYSAQIYFDFSGYTDIALGSAALFGIKLTENFNHPYAAASVVDFWRRWHISLTNWLRKYVYFPLGGSRVGEIKRYRNIMLVFLTSGIWHGANLTFIMWGLLHGLFQVLETLAGKLFPKKGAPTKAGLIFAHARTLALVALGWVFFRADSVANALRVLSGLFGSWASPGSALGLSPLSWALFLITVLLSGRVRDLCASKRLSERGAVVLCVVLTFVTLIAKVAGAGGGAANSFIYFNF